ncbi:lysophospholipase [Spiroplasma chinense]|uniref:Lysophospholipase n=1 Tax=Spiroplasma chinense TaxID=216932 RepID=A0A5B9Y3H7_9MOLU|nr:alpha/beta fold hydrolase [Spiroplasma chinense]QEH61698.1 lysophospholipase [Spiroplasma chinense]
MREQKLVANDKKELHLYIWDDVKEVKGVMQLVHGSCEHSQRYDEVAKELNKIGVVVVSNDHRGHGKTADLENNELGYFADSNGWELIIDDLKLVNDFIKQNWPNKKVILFGHSMGSFMARTYLIKYGPTVDGAVISGTAWQPQIVLNVGKSVAKKHIKKHGPKYIDKFIYNLSYTAYGKKFKKEGKTGTEWLSQNKESNQKFINDPLCGQIFTSSAFLDMFMGIEFNQKKKNLKKMDKQMPIILVSGKNDPVGSFGKGVKKTYKAFKKHKLNVEMKLYPELRHEILFENTEGLVLNDLLTFVQNNI